MIDYTKSKKIAVVYCKAGGGHEAASIAVESQIKAINEKIEFIRLNIFDLIGQSCGDFFEKKIWGSTQEVESIWLQEKFISFLPFFDFLFSSTALKSFKTFLEMHSIDHVIDTQPLVTQAILASAMSHSEITKTSIIVEKVLTEIPSHRSSYFIQRIQKVSCAHKMHLRLRIFDPQNKINIAAQTGLEQHQIINTLPPLRRAFLDESLFTKKDLIIQCKDHEEIELLKSLPGVADKINNNTFNMSLDKDTKYITLLLGANSSHQALENYVEELLEHFKFQSPKKTIAIMAFCPNFEIQQRLVKIYLAKQMETTVQLFPISRQNDTVIAPLYHLSHLTITKSGGLTSMELATVRKSPMLLHKHPIKGLPSWEQDNAEYLINYCGAEFIDPNALRAKLSGNFADLVS